MWGKDKRWRDMRRGEGTLDASGTVCLLPILSRRAKPAGVQRLGGPNHRRWMSALGPPANSVIQERFERETVIRWRYSNANDQICKNANATARISKSGGTGDPNFPAHVKRKAS